ncbi:MAG: hypothetical protein KY455_05660 [Euryarchaeota archaeon]|nr:hypothetical protein [Euryarchaeota archaeon]
MTQEKSSHLALEAYRTHQRQRIGLIATALVTSALFAIAYASWPAAQNKNFAEPVGLAMTVVSLVFIMADTQISVNIARISKRFAESSAPSAPDPDFLLLREPALSIPGVIFGILAMLWSYLASVASGGAELWGMIISGSAALLLWLLGAWRIRRAQTP